MMQKMLENLLIPGVRLLLQVFFRKIEIVNTANVPAELPIIFTPNHTNSLIDGMLARAFLPRDPRALAKATLWNNPITGPLMVASNSIPVYRQSDVKDAGKMVKNQQMFDACAQALAEKNCIVLFPEGTSHDEPELLPLKTGAARIALSAEQQHGPLSVRIMPVGLIFDNKQKFRSRVLIYLGHPVDPLVDIEKADSEDREQVNKVTELIEEGIKSVTLNYPSWEEANIMQRAADLYRSIEKDRPAGESLAGKFSINKQLADAYPLMKVAHPRKVTRVIKTVKSYDRLLRLLSIQHEHFIQDKPGIIHTISNLRKISLFLVRLPLAIVGICLNIIPFQLTRMVGTLKIPDHRISTVKVLSGIFLYPLLWTVEAMILGEGLLPAWFWWLLAPASGTAAVLFLEHHARLLDELITYLRLKTQSDIREELEERLENVDREVSEFIDTALKLES